MNFKFSLSQEVVISISGEHGVVIGQARYDDSATSYLVRYSDSSGRAQEIWWKESALTAKQKTFSDPDAEAARAYVQGCASTKVIHIVGPQGSGKSTLARAICFGKAREGRLCIELVESGLHEPGMPIDVNRLRAQGVREPYGYKAVKPDFLIVEHLEDPHPSQVAKGDLLIRLEAA
ncbi:MAG: ATP-binding protein [Limnohabitans sp.]